MLLQLGAPLSAASSQARNTLAPDVFGRRFRMPASSPTTVPRERVFVPRSDDGPEHSSWSICSSEEEAHHLIEESELQSSECFSQTPLGANLLTQDEIISAGPRSPEVNSEHTRGFLFISPPRMRNMQAIDDGSFSNHDGEEMVGNPFEIDSPAPVGVPRIGWASVAIRQPLENSPVPPPEGVRKLRRESFGLRCDCDDAESTNDAGIVFGGDIFQNSLVVNGKASVEQPSEEPELPLSPNSGTSNLHSEYSIPYI